MSAPGPYLRDGVRTKVKLDRQPTPDSIAMDRFVLWVLASCIVMLAIHAA